MVHGVFCWFTLDSAPSDRHAAPRAVELTIIPDPSGDTEPARVVRVPLPDQPIDTWRPRHPSRRPPPLTSAGPERRRSEPSAEPLRTDRLVRESDSAPLDKGLPLPSPNEQPADAGTRQVDLKNLDLRIARSDLDRLFGAEMAQDRGDDKEKAIRGRSPASRKGRSLTKIVQNSMKPRPGWVKPGNQEVLGIDRQQSFAAYLRQLDKKIGPRFSTFLHSSESVNNQLHRKVQSSFLKYNPFYSPPPDNEVATSLGSHPIGDLTLVTVTEFELDRTGRLNDILVVRSSGHAVFDAACVSCVVQSAPFPKPPTDILSHNLLAYIRWSFYRNPRRNGPRSGSGYILTDK